MANDSIFCVLCMQQLPVQLYVAVMSTRALCEEVIFLQMWKIWMCMLHVECRRIGQWENHTALRVPLLLLLQGSYQLISFILRSTVDWMLWNGEHSISVRSDEMISTAYLLSKRPWKLSLSTNSAISIHWHVQSILIKVSIKEINIMIQTQSEQE